MKSRRQFVRLAGTGILVAGVSSVYAAPVEEPVEPMIPSDGFGIGMAGYTFIQFSVEKTIEMMKRIGVNNLSLKEVHMPLKSTQEEINAVMEKFKSAGINVYTVGVIYMKTQESVDVAFEYAKMAGVNMIVGAPNYELLPYVEKKIREYNFRIAIHNHGPDNPLYPNATDVINHIKDMDPRIGICLDIGHTTRDGQDPGVDAKRYSKRLFDIHIKDVDKAAKDGTTIEMGRGIINIPKFVDTLHKIKYTGMCSLEFEKDMNDPLAGIAESIGYFKGVIACNRK
jgi:sugar phosphate isomerase/epimerase